MRVLVYHSEHHSSAGTTTASRPRHRICGAGATRPPRYVGRRWGIGTASFCPVGARREGPENSGRGGAAPSGPRGPQAVRQLPPGGRRGAEQRTATGALRTQTQGPARPWGAGLALSYVLFTRRDGSIFRLGPALGRGFDPEPGGIPTRGGRSSADRGPRPPGRTGRGDAGGPGRIRTRDTRLRRPMLCPAELRACFVLPFTTNDQIGFTKRVQSP